MIVEANDCPQLESFSNAVPTAILQSITLFTAVQDTVMLAGCVDHCALILSDCVQHGAALASATP